MSSSHLSDMPEKGWLSNIAGKAFSVLSVAAICLPLIGLGQAVGIAPGSYYAESYKDVGAAVVQMIENYKTPQEALAEHGATLLTPHSFEESYYGYSQAPAYKVDDTHISGIEGLAGMGLAATFGTAGIIAAGINRGEANQGEAFAPVKYTFSTLGEGMKPLGKIVLPLVAIDILGGNGPAGKAAGAALAGVGIAIAGTFAAAAVGGTGYLVGRSFYDNFVRDDANTPNEHEKVAEAPANAPFPKIV